MLTIHRNENRIEVHVKGGAVIPLPSSNVLRSNALNAANDFCGPDSLAAKIIGASEFDYEIAPGKDAIEQRIAVIVTTTNDYAAILNDQDHEVQPDFWSAIMEACPDAGDARVAAHDA